MCELQTKSRPVDAWQWDGTSSCASMIARKAGLDFSFSSGEARFYGRWLIVYYFSKASVGNWLIRDAETGELTVKSDAEFKVQYERRPVVTEHDHEGRRET